MFSALRLLYMITLFLRYIGSNDFILQGNKYGSCISILPKYLNDEVTSAAICMKCLLMICGYYSKYIPK